MDLDGRGSLREVAKEKTVISIYYVRKKSIFNKRGKRMNKNAAKRAKAVRYWNNTLNCSVTTRDLEELPALEVGGA